MTCLGPLSLEATEARLAFMGFLPEDVLCPTQVLLCPCQAAGGQWVLNKDPNLRQDQKVLAQDWLRVLRAGPKSICSSCLDGDMLPSKQCLRKGGPLAAPKSHVSRARTEAPCTVRAGTESASLASLRRESEPGVAME